VPVLADPDRPRWKALLDGAGTPLARFIPDQREGRVVADLLELAAPLDAALPVILEELKGWRVASDETVGRALLEAGASPARHSHVYSHDLRERPRPQPPAGVELMPLDHGPEALVDVYLAAHPPDHVDWKVIAGEDSVEHLRGVLDGAYGRLLDASGVALAGGAIVGAILVCDMPGGAPPYGGPWVVEVFRDPRHRGVGRALLQRALARTGGPALGLAVTHGNPAERLYRRLGFRHAFSVLSVDL
jgi:GNAT superfamily N-acetyltransferase